MSATDRRISCILPPGVAVELQRRLFHELGLMRVSVHSVRGFSGSDPESLFGRMEREVLSVIASRGEAERVFEWIYREGEIAELEGRFLYMARLSRATELEVPPDLPFESEG